MVPMYLIGLGCFVMTCVFVSQNLVRQKWGRSGEGKSAGRGFIGLLNLALAS